MPDFRSFLTRFGSYLGIVSGFMYLNQTASNQLFELPLSEIHLNNAYIRLSLSFLSMNALPKCLQLHL